MMPFASVQSVALLKKAVSFASITEQEREFVDWLAQYVAESGLLQIERFEDNLIFSYGEGRPWLWLCSHTDVVPPSPQHEGNPFEPVEKEGKIFGRGTTDAKGSGMSMLLALRNLALQKKAIKGKVSLGLTVCEEGVGHNNGMAFLREVIETPDAALIGEPTSLAPCVAQKGLLILKLVARGESGHAARIYGENAIYRMAEALQALKTIQFETGNPFLGSIKITPTTIQGGTAKNAHPEYCETYLDIRTIPEVSVEEIVDHIKLHLAPLEVEVVSSRYVAVGTDPDAAIVRAATAVTGKAPFGSPTASDWVFLADVPAVKIGPGHSEQSHTRNESIEIAQLEQGVKMYEQIILRYFEEIQA